MNDVQRIWFSPYSLIARRSLGAHASVKPREGSLLKFEFVSGEVGYADLHPWTELGDRALVEQLKLLAEKSLTPLTARSYELARIDARARSGDQSVFKNLSVPLSHYLSTDASSLTPEIASAVSSQGFRALKAKAGKNLSAERAALEAVFGSEQGSNLKLRLDLNSTLDSTTAAEWLLSLSPRVRNQIEFCEDPCRFNSSVWADLQIETGLHFFCDLESEALFEKEVSGVRGLILKPARQSLQRLRASTYELVVTSYLDHPLGQMGAAFEAARLAQTRVVGACGLLSHVAYEATPYSDQIVSKGPALLPNFDQSGFGFGELLENENWREL